MIRLLTTEDAAYAAGVKPATIRQWAVRGKLHRHGTAARRLWRLDELTALATRRGMATASGAPRVTLGSSYREVGSSLAGMDISTASTLCPHCGRHNPHHSHPDGSTPDDGDYSVCWGCRQVAIYTVGPAGLSVRKPTDEELAEAMFAPGVRTALAAMAESYTPIEANRLRGG